VIPSPAIVVVEIEGVLADTADGRRESLLHALAEEGVVLTDGEYAESCAGLPVRAAARAALARRGRAGDETSADLVTLRAERDFASRLASGVTLAPGARDFFAAAAGRARLAVVTRARRTEADAILALAGLADAFACVVADDDVAESKPSPAGYRRALERLARGGGASSLVARGAVALEDALPGIRAARAAALRCVAVGELAAHAAHAALEADAAVVSLAGQTPAGLAALVMPPPASLGTREVRRR
jgi:HAD superfamily hydrolase (TIGR01509 family)